MNYIGIDPGASGALCLGTKDGIKVWNTKKTHPKEALQEALGAARSEFTKEFDLGAVEPLIVYIEKVTGYTGGPPTGAGLKLMDNYGFWRGLMEGMNIPHTLVTPQKWQKGLPGLTGKKDDARKRALRDEAKRRYPTFKATLDNADAILIMDYARRTHK